jgi:hypothetical protein
LPLTRRLDMRGVPPAAFSPSSRASIPRSKSLASIRVSNVQVTIGVAKVSGSVSRFGLKTTRPPTLVRLSLEMAREDGSVVALKEIPFEVSISGSEIVLSTKNQNTPWKFSIRISKESKQMSVSFTLNYSGLGIDEAQKAVAFYDAVASGGKLRIQGRHPLTGGDLPIATAAIPADSYPRPDVRLVEILQRLAYIEKKTGTSFIIPHNDITYEVANIIAGTAQIQETGRAQYEAQPWTSVSSVEQAKQALETFSSGRPAPMAIHFEGQVIPIFGAHVMLGPVTVFCDRTYITAEDLEDLRNQLQDPRSDGTIKIRFTPFEGCPIEARYVNWLPPEEAQAIRQLPMYQRDDVTGREDLWTLPTVDVAKAVSLLESWYDEDAEEQKSSWNSLEIALERHRLSDRELFP